MSIGIKKNYGISASFLAGILLFLLPFAEIRCKNEKFVENSGLGFAFGKNYKITGQVKAISETFGTDSSERVKQSYEKGRAYPAALIAIVLGTIGLIVSLIYKRSGTSTMIIASTAAISLIILAFQLKADIKESIQNENNDISNNKFITINFTIWYYLSVISFLLAAFFSYLQKPWDRLHETPPKNAPQVFIKNPGEQSEFPSRPEESDLER